MDGWNGDVACACVRVKGGDERAQPRPHCGRLEDGRGVGAEMRGAVCVCLCFLCYPGVKRSENVVVTFSPSRKPTFNHCGENDVDTVLKCTGEKTKWRGKREEMHEEGADGVRCKGRVPRGGPSFLAPKQSLGRQAADRRAEASKREAR